MIGSAAPSRQADADALAKQGHLSPMPLTRRKRALRIALIVCLCLVVAGLIASWSVAGALVAPKPQTVGDPPGELNTTSFTIASDSGSTIHGWHTRPEHSDGVVVLLHGMGGSRLCMLERARVLHAAGYATVMIDLQAHGESPGNAITAGHLEKHDARAAVGLARREHPNEPIGVIGVSLGGAAAALASPLGIDALVIESVYPNIRDAIHNRVAAKLGPLSALPSALLLIQLKPRFGISPAALRPIDHLPNVGCPVFVLSGTEDRHTRVPETQAMFAAVRGSKELWLVDGAAHVDLHGHDPTQYRARILRFFDRHLRNGRGTLPPIPSPR